MHVELVDSLPIVKSSSQQIQSNISSSSTNSTTPIQSESSLDSSPTSSTTLSSSLQQNYSSDLFANNNEEAPNAKRIKMNNEIEFEFSVSCLNKSSQEDGHESINIKKEPASISNANSENKNINKNNFPQTKTRQSVLEKYLKNNMNTTNNVKIESTIDTTNKKNNSNNLNLLHKYFNKSTPILTQVVSSKTSNTIENDYNKNNIENEKMNIDIENLNNDNTSTSTDSNISTLTTQSAAPTKSISANNNLKNLSKKSFACLRNLGSTCYINCIIQVMRYTPGFVLSIHRLNKQIDYMRSLNNREIESEIMQNNDIIFVINLHELLAEMSDKEKLDRRPIYTPRKFVNTVWTSLSFWADGSQQDAHEFLQYTIHFINECDLFIRKLQQKYQIKQIPVNHETCIKPINVATSSALSAKTETAKSNVFLAQNVSNRVNTRSSARLAANSTNYTTSKQTSTTKTKNELAKSISSNNLINNQSLRDSNDQIGPLIPNIPANLKETSQYLPKPMPKIKSLEKSESIDSFMRTPTKGGASAFNLNMLDSLNNNQNSTQSESDSNTNNAVKSDKIVGKIEMNQNYIDLKNHTDIKNDDLEYKDENQYKPTNKKNNKSDNFSNQKEDNELIFRPLIKEETSSSNIDYDDNNTNTKLPIKVKFIKLDDKMQKYKMIDESIQNNVNNKNIDNNINFNTFIEEKDLVSKRLRETINNLPIINTKPKTNNCNYSNNINNNNNKKFKRDELIQNLNLNGQDDLDSNSFIIIDSDNDENDFILNNNSNEQIKKEHIEQNELLTDKLSVQDNNNNQKRNESLNIKKLKLETKSTKINITNSNNNNCENNIDLKHGNLIANINLKKCYILIEKLNIEKALRENELHLSVDSSPKLTTQQEKQQPVSKTSSKSSNNKIYKKLKSKSKTFPCTHNNEKKETKPESLPKTPEKNCQESLSNPKANILNDMEKEKINNCNEYFNDLDSITVVSKEKSINNNFIENETNNSPNLNSMKSKLRSSTSLSSLTTNKNVLSPSSQQYLSPAKALGSSIISNTINLTPNNNTSTLNIGSNSAPPSPAELLRKYSTSIGYVCEMDKLFKGSSITVTQCLECENLRKCPEAFYDRSIPVDTNYSIDDEDEYNGVDWISKCLKNESYLNDNSKYMCDICCSKQEAKIHTQYTQMPNILILHLLSYGITSSIDGNLNAQKLSNRSRLVNYFDFFSSKEQQQEKLINTNGSIQTNSFKSPITTRRQQQIQNLQKPVAQSNLEQCRNQFKLFAVVMHSGVSLNSGHYTAFVNYKIIIQCENNDLDNTIKSNKNDKFCSCLIESSIKSSNMNSNNLASSNECLNNIDNSSSSSSSSTSTLSQPEWLHFDDTKVKSLSSIEFHRKIVDSSYDSPYILFYVKE